MNVTLIYFSQTGNTRKVAMAMGSALREAGHEVESISLDKATPTEAIKGDLIGVGSPCFSSQAPTPIKTYLRSLPQLKGKQAFVFATSSAAPGSVLFDLAHLLQRKGAHVLAGFLSRGEVHHPAPHMKGQFAGRPNKMDLALARNFAKTVAKHVSSGCARCLLDNGTNYLQSRWGFYELVSKTSSDRMLRRLMPEPKSLPGRCDHCLLCMDQCPVENITLVNLPVLGDRCIRCYRCLTVCPQGVFEADWRYADPFLQFLYNQNFMRWFGDLKPGERIYEVS
jgi:flavodoxin/Fe-S-cluster-containing hydrogenase component 2